MSTHAHLKSSLSKESISKGRMKYGHEIRMRPRKNYKAVSLKEKSLNTIVNRNHRATDHI